MVDVKDLIRRYGLTREEQMLFGRLVSLNQDPATVTGFEELLELAEEKHPGAFLAFKEYQKASAVAFWKHHLDGLEGKVPELRLARMLTSPDNFGYKQGQIRPEVWLGKFDLLYALDASGKTTEARLIAKVSGSEIRKMREMEERAKEAEEFYCLQAMTPDELASEVEQLVALLAF